MIKAPNTRTYTIGQQAIRLEVTKDGKALSTIAELPLGENFEQIAECVCHFHNSYFEQEIKK